MKRHYCRWYLDGRADAPQYSATAKNRTRSSTWHARRRLQRRVRINNDAATAGRSSVRAEPPVAPYAFFWATRGGMIDLGR